MSPSGFLRQNVSLLSTGFLLTFVSGFGQTYFISVFAGSIRNEFGLSHGQWGSIYAAGTMASAAVMIWSGMLTDIFRVRVLAIFVLGGLSASCIGMAVLHHIALLPFVIFALRLFGQGMSTHLATVAMARWFVRTRGRALSIAGLGFSAGEALLPLVFVALMSFATWRSLWILAAVVPILILPIVLKLLRQERTPQSVAEENPVAGMLGRHWSRVEALRHWLFWAIVPALIGPSAFGTALFFHQVHVAEVKQWSHLELVSLFPLYTLTSILSMVVSGLAVDRFGSGWLMVVAQLPVSAGFVILGTTQSLWGAAFALMLIALSFGANAILLGAFWAEFYGTKNLGGLRALAAAVMVMGSAIGPGLTGLLIDHGYPFPIQMRAIGIWFLAILVLVWIAMTKANRLLQAPKVDVVGT